MEDFIEYAADVIESAHANRGHESQKTIQYRLALDRLILPVPPNSSDFRDIRVFIEKGLEEVDETIKSYPSGVGELQNRGNVTLGAIKTQFERASDVLNRKRRENTSSLAWVLQHGAEQAFKEEVSYLKAINEGKGAEKSTKDKINTNLQKLSVGLKHAGIKIDTPQLQ